MKIKILTSQIEKLLAEGLSQSEIARKFAVSRQAISFRLLNPRKYSYQKAEAVNLAAQEAAELRKQGLTYKTIGDKLGVSAPYARVLTLRGTQ